MISHSCAIFLAFTNVRHHFSGSKYDLYCLDFLAISWKLSIFSKSVDMIPSRFCCFLLLFVAPNWHPPPCSPPAWLMGQYGSDFRIFGEQNLSTPLFNNTTARGVAHWYCWIYFWKSFQNILTLGTEVSLMSHLKNPKRSLIILGTKSNRYEGRCEAGPKGNEVGDRSRPPRLLVDKHTKYRTVCCAANVSRCVQRVFHRFQTQT